MPLSGGQTFAGYRVIRLLGSGGMAEVYLAQHPRLPRRDALKLLPREWSADNEYRDRFNRGADLACAEPRPVPQRWHFTRLGPYRADRRSLAWAQAQARLQNALFKVEQFRPKVQHRALQLVHSQS
jgi:serine/threonine protein kinase